MTVLGNPIYLDTSALAKLVVDEPESPALTQFIAKTSAQVTTSQVGDVELIRAVLRRAPASLDVALEVLTQTVTLPINRSIQLKASYFEPPSIRALDAIHIATALEIRADLNCVVTYDRRMIEASERAGLRVMSPGMSPDS